MAKSETSNFSGFTPDSNSYQDQTKGHSLRESSFIEFSRFSFRYNDSDHDILSNINLSIDRGDFILITGVSGCGKSTLIRAINGLIPHFYGGIIEGEVLVNNKNPIEIGPKQMAEDVGYVFQIPDNQIFMNTVVNELVFSMENHGYSLDLIQKRVEETLDAIGIAPLRNRSTKSLSGGEKQKVAIASVLILHPKILILDEPTAELDPKSAEEILLLLEKLNSELGITIILIEHRIERILPYIDRLIVMQDGKVLADDNPREYYQKCNSQDPSIPISPLISLIKYLDARNASISLSNQKFPLTIKESRKCFSSFLSQVTFNLPKWMDITNSITQKFQKHIEDGALIRLDSVFFQYVENSPILDNISFSCYPGELVVIMGRNGSGKTTLLKSLLNLVKIQKGIISVNGISIKGKSPEHLVGKIGYLFQNPSLLFFQDTVFEEVEFILKNQGIPKEERRKAVNAILTKFNLIQYQGTYPRYLSVGEQQKVALASIMIAQPRVLLLDEPTHGIDPHQKRDLLQILDNYRRDGNLVILVSHDVESIAQYADRVLLMSDGKIIADQETHRALSQALLFSPQINRLIRGFENIPQDLLTLEEFMSIITN